MPIFSPQSYLHRSAYLWLLPQHSRKQLIFWLGAVLVGAAAAAFAKAADYSQDPFLVPRGWSVWGASAATVVGFALCAHLARRYAPGARGSGIPGGLFSPSLSVGAGLGEWAAYLMPGTSAVMIMTPMMAACFAAVVQAPLTAFVIVIEVTADLSMTLPLMTTTLLAAGVSRLICRFPLYQELSRTF